MRERTKNGKPKPMLLVFGGCSSKRVPKEENNWKRAPFQRALGGSCQIASNQATLGLDRFQEKYSSPEARFANHPKPHLYNYSKVPAEFETMASFVVSTSLEKNKTPPRYHGCVKGIHESFLEVKLGQRP